MDFGSRLDCLSGRLFSLIIRYGRWQGGEYEAAAREVGLGCEVEWFPGGWMSRQRFAGRLGGKAEFPCGLTGGGGGRGASLSA